MDSTAQEDLPTPPLIVAFDQALLCLTAKLTVANARRLTEYYPSKGLPPLLFIQVYILCIRGAERPHQVEMS